MKSSHACGGRASKLNIPKLMPLHTRGHSRFCSPDSRQSSDKSTSQVDGKVESLSPEVGFNAPECGPIRGAAFVACRQSLDAVQQPLHLAQGMIGSPLGGRIDALWPESRQTAVPSFCNYLAAAAGMLLWRERVSLNQSLAQSDAVSMVDLQDFDGRAADRRSTDQNWPVPTKVVGPIVLAGVEETHDSAGAGIDASEVRTFAGVAMVATPGPIRCCVRAPVLTGDDVFNVKRQVRFIILMDAAILTAVASPLPNDGAQGTFHRDLAWRVKSARALAWRIAMNVLVET